MLSPLFGHRVCYSLKGSASFLPSIFTWRHFMDTRLSSLNRVRRYKFRESLQPQASPFRLPVPEHPRLNDLVRLPDSGRNDTDRVFKGNLRDGCGHKGADKFKGGFLFGLLLLEPSRPTNTKVGAWRVKNCQIKTLPF